VAVDARFVPGTGGGVETVIVGLAQGFAKLPPHDVSVTFVTYAGHNDWIRPLLDGQLRMIEVAPPRQATRVLHKSRLWAVRRHGGSFGMLPGRDRVMSGLGADVVHFPRRSGAHVGQPFIFHPHDLQHRHLPDFFTARQIASREVVYGSLCRRAAAIAVGTSWVKRDLVEQLRVEPGKVFVIPLAPVEAPRHNGSADLSGLRLPGRYLIYPAASWPHKNHRRLFEALALLRRDGLDVPLVLTGPRPAGVDLASLVTTAGVDDLVLDLGYLPQAVVESLTAAAVAMVIPTLFEAASFPIWEAFRLGTPVACSNVTSLPRQVGTSGLIFDPNRAPAIADAIRDLWSDPDRRARLSELGRERVSEFSWDRTARQFLALYRHLGGRELSPANKELLEREPVL
jgi:glycosyltransferase involved in cell wall biosynthesis